MEKRKHIFLYGLALATARQTYITVFL